MEKSVTALQTIILFDIAKLKLFFINFFTNQDSDSFKHFKWGRKFTIMLIITKDIVDEQLSILTEGLYELL